MTSAFISYSSKDLGFVKKLAAALKSPQRKRELELWVDLEGIPPSAEWWKEITKDYRRWVKKRT